MSVERDEVARALEGSGARWELLAKEARGASWTRRRGEPTQSESILEKGSAVRVALEDGRSALASAAGSGDLVAIAERALQLARRQSLPAEEPTPRRNETTCSPPLPPQPASTAMSRSVIADAIRLP